MNSYVLSAGQSVILYGAATIGALFKQRLEKCGIRAAGFMDQRADEIGSFEGCPVFKPEDLDQLAGPDLVIIISVKNVFEHEKIAGMLLNKGYRKLIYRPYDVLSGAGTPEDIRINDIYSMIEAADVDHEYQIPYATGRRPVKKDFALIEENGEYCTVRVPFELVFTDYYPEKDLVWNDVSIFHYIPHIQLFSSLNGSPEGEPEEYVRFCTEAAKRVGGIKTTAAWKSNVIKNRLDVFYHMELSYEMDPDFFTRNAPFSIWNDKGYFNLRSGKHRAVFCLCKGKRYFTLKVEKEAFSNWLKAEDAGREFEALCGGGEIGIPVLHPYYYQAGGPDEMFYSSGGKKIMYLIGDYVYHKYGSFPASGIRVFDRSDSKGYFSRCLFRMGYQVTRDVSEMTPVTKAVDRVELNRAKDCIPVGNYEDGGWDIIMTDLDAYENVSLEGLDSELVFLICSDQNKEMIMDYYGEDFKIFHRGIVGQKTKYIGKYQKKKGAHNDTR